MNEQNIVTGGTTGYLTGFGSAVSNGTLVTSCTVTYDPEAIRSLLFPASTSSPTCAIGVDTLRQIRILLRCIQQPVVSYDSDLLTMVQAAVGYCGEKAAEIEDLLPEHGMLEDGE